MKRNIILILVLALLTCCSENSVTEEFNNANGDGSGNNGGDNSGGNVPSKLITKIIGTSVQDPSENITLFVSYDANDRVSSVSSGDEASVLVYNNGSLSTVTSSGGTPFNVEDLFASPYDAFEIGQVLQYDNNGNPINIAFIEEVYDSNSNSYITVQYTAEIFYDDEPNPYFYTLQAAGVIEVLDGVELNFSLNPTNPEIVQARALFPLNNINRIIYKDENSVVLFEILVDYVYNSVDHPITATVTATDVVENIISVYTLAYTYRE